MIKDLYACLAAFLLCASSFSQGKIDDPQKIKNIRAIPLRLVNKDWQEVDPNSTPLHPGENVRIRFEVTMDDGTVMKTHVPGLEGDLKFNLFKYKVEGKKEESGGGLGGLLTGGEVFSVTDDIANLNHEGRLNVTIKAWFKKSEDRTFNSTWPVAPPKGDAIVIDYSQAEDNYKDGMDITVKITLQTGTDNRKYLRLEFERMGEWKKLKMEDKFYLIDVEREKVMIDARGEDGGSPGDQSSYKTVGDDGYDGGDGGHVIVYISKDAKNYAGLIDVRTEGGKGGRAGKGSINYGRDGRHGKAGKIEVLDM